MRFKFSLILPLCFWLNFCLAQERFNNGAESEALSNATVTMSDIEALFQNQAGLARCENIQISIAYKNSFLIKELSNRSAGVVYPAFLGNFFGSFSQVGYSLWNENLTMLGFARTFGSHLSASLSFHYFSQKLCEDNRRFSFVTFSAGAIYCLESFSLGIHVFNPSNENYNFKFCEKSHPFQLRIGLKYTIEDHLTLFVETRESDEIDHSLRIGLRWSVDSKIVLLGGTNIGAQQESFGMSYFEKKWKLTFAFSNHSALGFSPSLTLSYKFR